MSSGFGTMTVTAKEQFEDVRLGYDLAAPIYDAWGWQQVWRQKEYPRVVKAIDACFSSPRILDLGCGTGAFAVASKRLYGTYTGIDGSQEMIRKAGEKNLPNATFFEGSILDWPCPTAAFDVVVCLRVVNHIADVTALASKARQALVHGGLFLISAVAHEHRFDTTTLPTAFGRCPVPTYKHDAAMILGALGSHRSRFRFLWTADLKASKGDDLLPAACSSIDRTGTLPFGRIFAAVAI